MQTMRTIVTLTSLELMRLTRSGRSITLRVLYATALLLALLMCWDNESLDDRGQGLRGQQLLAEICACGYFLAMTVAIHIITPLYVGGIIVDDRRTHMTELLLTTDLNAAEIVLSKYLARVAQLVSVMLTGLPVIALLQMWGGLDFTAIVLTHIASIISIMTVAAWTTAASALARTSLGAAGIVTGWSALIVVIGWGLGVTSPFAFWIAPLDSKGSASAHLSLIILYAICHAAFTLASLREALKRYRVRALADLNMVAQAPALAPVVTSSPSHPAIEHDAQTLWRAIQQRARVAAMPSVDHMVAVAMLGAFVYLFVWIALITFTSSERDHNGIWDERLQVLTVHIASFTLYGVAALWALWAGLMLAGELPGERQKNTLDLLFLLPGDRREILVQRWRQAWGTAWVVPAFVLPAALAIGSFLGTLIWLAPLTLVSCAADVALALCLALWCSTINVTAVGARVGFLVLWCGYHFGTWWLVPAQPQGPAWRLNLFALVPVRRAWWAVPESHTHNAWATAGVSLLASLGVCGVAWLLWRDTARRFEREGK